MEKADACGLLPSMMCMGARKCGKRRVRKEVAPPVRKATQWVKAAHTLSEKPK